MSKDLNAAAVLRLESNAKDGRNTETLSGLPLYLKQEGRKQITYSYVRRTGIVSRAILPQPSS